MANSSSKESDAPEQVPQGGLRTLALELAALPAGERLAVAIAEEEARRGSDAGSRESARDTSAPEAVAAEVDAVLDEIIGWRRKESKGVHVVNSPDLQALREFAALLATDPTEESLQQFLSRRPQFLLGLFGSRDIGDLCFLCKPPVGTDFYADFALLGYSQGGCSITLVELEPSDAVLFTRSRTPAKRLQTAIGQINDWRRWIERNTDTFVRDMVNRGQRAPMYNPSESNTSVRFVEADVLRDLWDGFSGFTDCSVGYAVVIGRWSKLSREDRVLLMDHNQAPGIHYSLRTYDQLARQALSRPDVYDF